MDSQVACTAGRITVEVSVDRMAAHVRVPAARETEGLSAEEILARLTEAEIVVDNYATRRAAEFVTLVTTEGVPDEPFEIARGRPVVEATDEAFEWADRLTQQYDAWHSDASINYYKLSSIVTVDVGELLGRLRPATPGEEGANVFGTPIPPQRTPVSFELSDTIGRTKEDPNVLIAEAPGRIVLANHRLAIVEVCKVQGDVDFKSGSVDSSVDVNIADTVRDNFSVKSAKSITVGGAIEAATVEAAGDVVVRGGVLGHTRGRVHAGGEIVAKFCEGANLRAKDDISIHKEAIGSRIHTECVFRAERGAVIGGCIYAKEGAEVAILGRKSGVKTAVVVGVDPNVISEAEQLDRQLSSRRAAVAKIRNTVQPLLANCKQLTPEQKERATELLFNADTIEEELVEKEQLRQKMLTDAGPLNVSAIMVSRIAYAGVGFQIGTRRAVLQADLRGPVRIEEREIENATELVAVSQLSGAVTVLPTIRITNFAKQGLTPKCEEGVSFRDSGG